MSVETIRTTREEREARAEKRAAALREGLDLYADSYHVMRRTVLSDDRVIYVSIIECESHWDACLVLLAYGKEK